MILFSSIFILTGCGHLFYYPDRVLYFDPKKHNIEYQELKFKSLDGTELVGWYFKAQPYKGRVMAKNPPKPTKQNPWPALRKPKNRVVIHFHGNAQNVSSHFSQLYWLTQFGYDYFIVDYRGFGGSHGKPTHKGVQEDVVAAVEFILNGGGANGDDGAKPERIILYGQSIGGASLLGAYDNILGKLQSSAEPQQADSTKYLQSKIQAVVIEGAFGSYQRIARRKMASWWLSWPLQWLPYILLSDKYAGEGNADKITPTPLLVIHGKADTIVETREGEEIFKVAKEPKQLWLIDGANHLQSFYVQHGAYQEKLVEYLEDLEKP